MKTTFLRTLLTLGSLISLTSFATAEQRGISSAFELWTGDDAASSSNIGVQEAAYVPDDLKMEDQLAESGLTTCSYDDSSNDCPTHDYQCDSRGDDDCSDDGYDEGCTSASYEGGGCGDACPCGDACGCEACACGSCGDCCSDGCGHDCYACGCDSCCGDCSNYDMNAGMFYAEIQNIFMRTHVSSEVFAPGPGNGKLREKYEWSPRVVLGYESPGGLGGRMRWWSYSRTNSTVDGLDSFHVDLDVLDAEGTARFSSKRADLVIAGGFRYANFEIEEDDNEIAADLPGITFAADGRMAICCAGRSQWSGVCGARWSLLGGDWEGDNNSFVNETFDDNVTTHEIYGGFEYLCHNCNYDLYARLVLELQNWHSDALDETTATDSIGFVGPAIHGGVSF